MRSTGKFLKTFLLNIESKYSRIQEAGHIPWFFAYTFNTMQKQTNFLTHVAGLRGLAILLVVWFHISQNNAVMPPALTLPFGCFGVDVFFVIMGYFLIGSFTKGKINALDWRSAISFSVGKFYRLWPPLAVMLIAGTILRLFFLDCDQLSTMARTAKRALEGTANIYLAKSTAGYFAEGSGMNPFLHTWYLSVTVQFFLISYIGYVLWALCCCGGWGWPRFSPARHPASACCSMPAAAH